jgi:hypothetical protein
MVLLHTVWFAGFITVGVGLTVRLKLFTAPEQAFKVELTLMVAETGVNPALTGINAGISPLPEVPKPISWLLLQLNVGIPPLAAVENIILAWLAPAQSTSLLNAFTAGVGFTVMVKLIGEPSQPDPLVEKCGVAVMVATIGLVPGFTAVNDPIFPVPDAARPISG